MKIDIKICHCDAYKFMKLYYLKTEMGPKHCRVQHAHFKGKEAEAWKGLPSSHSSTDVFVVSITQSEIQYFSVSPQHLWTAAVKQNEELIYNLGPKLRMHP